MKNRRKVKKINIKQANKNWFNKNEIKLVNLIKIAGKKELCIITILQTTSHPTHPHTLPFITCLSTEFTIYIYSTQRYSH